MKPLELIEVGDEIGMIFPEELCARLQVGVGDDVHLTPTTKGFSLHSNQSESKVFFEKTMDRTILSQDSAS
jgi:hypothetical protein